MTAAPTLAGLERLRAERCRLTADRALESFDEAAAFLADRGLLTRTQDSALPSLFGACHEQGWRPGSGGFGEWPATKYRWFWQLGRLEGVIEVAFHRGKSMLLTREVAALADPICRAELERHANDDRDAATLLEHLAAAGPSTVEDCKVELGWSASRLRDARGPLQRIGAVVGNATTLGVEGGGHIHTSVLARWDQVFGPPATGGGLADLLVAAVTAAVVAPERELSRWFSWTWLWRDDLVDGLVAEGRLWRPQIGRVAGAFDPAG